MKISSIKERRIKIGKIKNIKSRKSGHSSNNNVIINNNQKIEENLKNDKKPLNDNYFNNKNTVEADIPAKKNIIKINENKIPANNEKDNILSLLPKVKIMDVTNPREEKLNDKELIERHKMLIKLYNIEKEVEEDENETEADEEKLKTEDVNACTKDFNVVIVNIFFKKRIITNKQILILLKGKFL